MKNVLIWTAASVLLTLSPAFAGPDQPRSPRDTNTATEFWDWDQESRNDWNRNDFSSYDTNKNGRLDDMEWKLLEDNWSHSNTDAWSHFDQNNDGKLDDQERRNVRLNWNAAQRRSPFDLDGDGYLNEEERQLYREKVDPREWK